MAPGTPDPHHQPKDHYATPGAFAVRLARTAITNATPFTHTFVQKYAQAQVAQHTFGPIRTYTWTHHPNTTRTLIYLHGGAYIDKPTRWHIRTADRLAQHTRARVLFPAYPLLPTTAATSHHHMAQFYTHCQNIYGPNIALVGDSAGGGLAFGMTETCINAGIPVPRAIIGFSPWLDVTCSSPGMRAIEPHDPLLSIDALMLCGQAWAGSQDPRNPIISPLFTQSAAQYPPVGLSIGTRDVLLPEVLQFAQTLTDAGCETELLVDEGQTHIYQLFPTPAGRAAQDFAISHLNNWLD